MTKKKILITGALGNIGSKLIRNLDNKLIEKVTLLDNLESQRYFSIFDLPNNPRYKFIEADVRTCDFDKILKDVNVVIHLAAITNPESRSYRDEDVESINFLGLKRVADACLKSSVKLFFPSTTSVYGSQAAVVDESCEELRPQSFYAETKLNSETYLKELGIRGLEFVICRFGTIFGYSIGMHFYTAVNKFVWQAATGQSITVWRTAWKQKRPYLAIDDCVRAISFILEKDLFNGEVYNVLTKNYTVKEVAEAIKKLVPNLRVKYVDSNFMNQLSYDVSMEKFKKLGFKTEGNLKKSLSENISKLSGIL